MRTFFSQRTHLIYILPAIVILGVLTIVPTVLLYFLSITNYELGASSFKIVWFENYFRLFKSVEFQKSFFLSVYFSVVVTAIELVLGFFLAKLLDREMRLKSVVFACLIVPIAMTPSITGQIWKLMFNSEYGVLNFLLHSSIGQKIVWLSPENALMSTMLVDIWQNTPFVALILYAGLRSLPVDPYEAALTDGASTLQVFRHITLPLLKPMILLAVIFRLIDSLRLFDIPFSLTQGGPGSATEFMSLHVYRLGFAQTGWVGRASAAAILLMILITIVSTILLRFFRKGASDKQ
ncbi:carbohydrate ABC transporter permease [Paenibacillus yanchengensis]|uniref:Carbohydrate ABC transporter permease n=1 Tax=Paenibacillus yanchengensis TaxID=2035833 RepID=A0ABW4YEX0_9BACL